MDKVVDSGSTDTGSIPVRDARKTLSKSKSFFICIGGIEPERARAVEKMC